VCRQGRKENAQRKKTAQYGGEASYPTLTIMDRFRYCQNILTDLHRSRV
jgi:hypothetical protein